MLIKFTRNILNYTQIKTNMKCCAHHILLLTLLLISSCSISPEKQLARRVREYQQKPSVSVLSSGFDKEGTPYILLTDGTSILIDSLQLSSHAVPVLGLNTIVSKVTHKLYFKDGETLAIRRKKSQARPLREIVGIPASDYFSRVRIAPVPNRQAFVIAENDGVCLYYSLDHKDDIYVLYGVNLDEVKTTAEIGSVLVGDLNENEYWYPRWKRDELFDFLTNREHLFFVPVNFDSNMSLIGMSESLLYHGKNYPLSTLKESSGKIAQILEGDLRADRIRRRPTPMPISTSTTAATDNGASQSQSVKEDIDDVLEFLSIAGQFGVFTEEIDEISTALRIIDLFL